MRYLEVKAGRSIWSELYPTKPRPVSIVGLVGSDPRLAEGGSRKSAYTVFFYWLTALCTFLQMFSSWKNVAALNDDTEVGDVVEAANFGYSVSMVVWLCERFAMDIRRQY